MVTITGDGFDASTTQLNFVGTDSLQVTYNTITFVTRPTSANTIPLDVYVNTINAQCNVSPACQFQFDSSIAPTLSAVSPTSVNSATTITLTGTNFGSDSTKLSVKIGKQTCAVTAASGTSATCTLAGLEVGAQSIQVNVIGVGNALDNSVQINGAAAVSAISPNSGSIYGGTEVTITGNGFDSINNTQIRLGTSVCKITSLSVSSVKCITSAGNGLVNSVIR